MSYISKSARLLVFAFIYGMISVPTALGQESFAPVVVLGVEGNVDDELKKEIVESVSAAIRTSVLQVYSEETYGTGRTFKPRAHKSGPMGIAGRVFRGVDRQLENLIQTEIKPLMVQIPDGESIQYTVEMLWSKKPHVFAQASETLPGGQMFGLLWSLVTRAVGDSKADESFELISDVVDMPFVQASDIPGGKQTLYDQGKSAYEWMREGQNSRFLPLYVGMHVTVHPHALHLDITTTAKPGDLNLALDQPEPKDYIKSENLIYRPPYYATNLPLSRFLFERSYHVNGGGNRPTAKVSFGHMVGKDVRALAMCRQRCDEVGPAGAEHIYRYAPTVRAKLRVPETFPGLGLRGPTHRVFSSGVAKVNEYLDLYILMNEITFDLSGDSIEIVAEKSHLPMVLRLTGPLNGRSYFDVTGGSYGFDFMKKLVASEAAREITITIASTLREGDVVVNQQIAGIVGRLNSLIE